MPVVTLRLLKAVFFLGVLVLGTPFESGVASAQTPSAARRPIVFIPGLLGSRLCRDNPANPATPTLVWGSAAALKSFPSLRVTGGTDDIKPCGILRDIVFLGLLVQDVYAPVIAHLHKLGYREGVNLFIFDYDWRRSAFDNAAKLEGFVREKIPDPFQRFDILAHSMGGVVARIYALRHDNTAQLARLFSAGAPFHGSVKVYATVEKGWGALNAVMGGLPAFRRTMLSFPSIYELAPRYTDCCDAGKGAFAPGEADAWRALKWDGVDPQTMTDLKIAAGRASELRTLMETPLPAGVEDVLLVGVDQRTPQRVTFEMSDKGAVARMRTTWQGDGTVLRDSAVLATAIMHPTSFSTHQKILQDPQIQQFLEVALTRDVAEAMRSVKVRPRGLVRTAAGLVTELVGIALEPDEQICRTGDTCKVHVHVRLGNMEKLKLDTLKLSGRMPGRRAAPIPLKPDPAASDPTNPFEQSFVGHFTAGAKPGDAVITAAIKVEGGTRIVEQAIAVMAK